MSFDDPDTDINLIVTFNSKPTGIDDVLTDEKTSHGIYTISGTRMSHELKDLPSGVYIVNGRKIVKK